MAYTRCLDEGWTLTDGVFGPLALAEPVDVMCALREQGLIARDPGGSELLHQEWVSAHPFTYALTFDCADGEADLVFIRFAHLAGAGTIRVNGHLAWRFDGEGVCFPLTCCPIHERDNVLKVTFDPCAPGAARGIIGDVTLRYGSDLLLERARFSGSGDVITSEIALHAYSGGKYTFNYTVSLGGEHPVTLSFTERPPMLRSAAIRHELRVPDAVMWDASNPDETGYLVKLSIERAGVQCESLWAHVALLPKGHKPTRIVRIDPALIYPESLREQNLTKLCELGAEAVVFDPESRRPQVPGASAIGVIGTEDEERPIFLENALPYGLITLERTDANPLEALPALAPLDALQQLGKDWGYWPLGGTLYKYFDQDLIDVPEYENMFGVNAAGDAGRCIRLSLALQAELLYRAASEARLRGEPMLLDHPIERVPQPESRALIESSGSERPACAAIESAWSPVAAYVRLPEGFSAETKQIVEFEVYLFQDGPARPLSVTVSCFGQDERQKFSDANFDANDSGATSLGNVQMQMPESPQLLTIRCDVKSGGALLWRRDSILSIHIPSEPPLGALLKTL